MSGLRIFVEAASGQFEQAMAAATKDVKVASLATMNRAADIAKVQGRADIAAAGFSTKWQNALQAKVYPQGGVLSAQPTLQVYHKIGFSQIFEEGGPIFGSPLLWLPLKDAPKTIGRNRTTPALYASRVGPLFAIVRQGKPPLLAARIKDGRGPRGGIKVRTVPMFVGIDAVNLRDRFSIREIVQRIADDLPEIYASVFNEGS